MQPVGPSANDPTVQSPPPIGVGTVVAATYELTSVLGRGGMGVVWAARHLRLPGKIVALKLLHNGDKHPEAYARFRREAEIVSRIGHPNIIEVIDFNTLPNGTPYIVLEYLQGESLAQRLTRGRLPLGEALDFLRQMGSALQAAHHAGIVHRDLKPENIFLCPTDAGGEIHERIKVLDFGISKIKGSQSIVTQDSALIGTPQYMAPEQALGRNQEIDGRTDLFALGGIVYEMLAGHAPFAGEAMAGVLYSIVHEPHVSLAVANPDVPAAISAAVDRALAKLPADRFPDVGAFVEAATGRPLASLRNSGDRGVRQEPAAPTGGPAKSGPVAHAETSLLPTGGTVELPPPPDGAVNPVTRTSRLSRWGTIAAIGGAIAAAAIVGGIVAHRRPQPDNPSKGTIAPEAKVPADQHPIAATVVDAAQSAVTTDGPSAASGSGSARPSDVQSDRHRNRTVVRERAPALAPETEAEIIQAEQALQHGDTDTAVRLAQHSLFAGKSARAFVVIARARCLQGDLSAAHAALARLTPSQQAPVMRDCAAHGVDLR